MVKKFLLYFAICFVIVFSFLNYSSVMAEIRFWLDSSFKVQARDMSATAAEIAPNSVKTTAPVKTETVAIDPNAGFEIVIPEIGIAAPIVIEPNPDPNVIYKDLKKGVVHYGGSAMIGQTGTAIILGHSWTTSWRPGNYDSVFSLIGNLKAGDTYTIKNGANNLVYRVSGNLVFNPLSTDPKIENFIHSDGSSVVLITCWPAGTSLERMAVKADLIK